MNNMIRVTVCLLLFKLIVAISYERYHFLHKFRLNKNRKNRETLRFLEPENRFIGDDGSVVPVVNVHVEARSPIENDFTNKNLDDLEKKVFDLKSRELSDNHVALNALHKEVDLVKGLLYTLQNSGIS